MSEVNSTALACPACKEIYKETARKQPLEYDVHLALTALGHSHEILFYFLLLPSLITKMLITKLPLSMVT